MSKVRNIVVANTKGGVGKSIVTTQILPVAFFTKDLTVNVYQIDDNNKLRIKSDFINLKNIKINEAEDIIDKIEIDKYQNNNVINIIDCGGGSDTKVILNYLKESEFDNIEYYIPTNSDLEQVSNVNDTIDLIRAFDKKAKITLVLNRVRNMSDLQEEFFAFFDKDDIYELEDKLNDKEISKIQVVEETKIFSLLKNKEKTTLLDFYVKNEDLAKNANKLKSEVATQKDKTQEEIKIEFKRVKVKIKNVREAKKVAEDIISSFRK